MPQMSKGHYHEIATALGDGAQKAVEQTRLAPEIVALVLKPIADSLAAVCTTNAVKGNFDINKFSLWIRLRFRSALPLEVQSEHWKNSIKLHNGAVLPDPGDIAAALNHYLQENQHESTATIEAALAAGGADADASVAAGPPAPSGAEEGPGQASGQGTGLAQGPVDGAFPHNALKAYFPNGRVKFPGGESWHALANYGSQSIPKGSAFKPLKGDVVNTHYWDGQLWQPIEAPVDSTKAAAPPVTSGPSPC